MNSPFETQIELRVERSPSLTTALLLSHLLSVLPLLLIHDPVVRGCLLLVILLSAVHAWRKWVCEDASRVRRLTVRSDGAMQVTTAEMTEQARLVSASVVHPLLTALTLQGASGRRYSVILRPDNVAEEPFRRLRARLRSDPQAFSASGGVIAGGDGNE